MAKKNTKIVKGKLHELPISDLYLDPKNPRLPEGKQNASQEELLEYIADAYEPFEIARSVAAHGYFPSEPVIAIQEGGHWIVVEGNRRLTALKLLLNPELAEEIGQDSEKWEEIAGEGLVPETIPVIEAQSRKEVAPIIGFRHISGIEPWDPWAKARFLASLVDEEGLTFDETAAEVGEKAVDVQTHYRNYHILKQARDEFNLAVENVQDRFGVFTRTLQDPNVRAYMSAPQGREVVKGKSPLPTKARPRVEELLSWAFGDSEHQPVFTDSRKIADLGRVLSSPEALQILKNTRNLEDAHIAAGGLLERLQTRLARARSNLEAALIDFDRHSDDSQVIALVSDCARLISQMQDQASA